MADWAAGRTILGEYTIERELGRGGMGCVWQVKSNSTGRRFAVKQTILEDEKTRKAFLSELQTWIDLPEHPNIVPCRFFRTVGDEIVIFTDYIEGGSLKEWIDQGKLTTLEQILDVAIQLAWGLHAIHERGLVHQDVKPGNVLMTAEGVPMVADFGLARARQVVLHEENIMPAKLQGQHSVYVPGAGLMTKEYASPEQRAGKPLSCKTDIWSWGVSVMDIFMGGVSCPHGGHIAADVWQTFLDNGGQEKGLPKIPSIMVEILRKCFQNDPAKRWSHLGEVVADLKTAYSKIAGENYSLELAQIVHRGAPQAALVGRLTAYGGEWYNPRYWLEMGLRLSGQNPEEAKTLIERHGRSRRGQLVSELAIFDEAKSIYLDMVKRGNRDLEPELASLCMNKALVHLTADDGPGAIAEYDQCIAIRRRLVEQEGRREMANALARAFNSKADVLKNMGDLVGAAALYDQLIEVFCTHEELGGEIAITLESALIYKAIVLKKLGDSAGASAIIDQFIAIFQKLEDQEEEKGALAFALKATLLKKAVALAESGDSAGAAELVNEILAIQQRLAARNG